MTQTNQNKDYSWLEAWRPIFVNGVIPSEFRAAIVEQSVRGERATQDVAWIKELLLSLHTPGFDATGQPQNMLLPLEEIAKAEAAIQAKIDEHYISKGEAGDLNFREEFKKLKDLRNNRFMDEPEFDARVEHLAAVVHAHPAKDGYCCACDADKALPESEVEQREALLMSDLAWCIGKLRGLGYPAESIEAKYWPAPTNKAQREGKSHGPTKI